MTERLFDRNNYSKKTLDTFEVMSSYFVDIYYNHLYTEAKNAKINQSTSSITEGYKHALNAYMRGIDDPRSYKRTLIGMHDFFQASGFTSMSFTECIERVTTEFIPKDYYATVSKQQKTSILKQLIIGQSNKKFMEKLVRRFMSMIIDNHDDADNIRVLQDEFNNILMIEREGIFHRFIESHTKSIRVKSNTDVVLIERMQGEIKTLLKEKLDLKKLTISLKKIIIDKDTMLKASMQENEFLKRANIELKNELEEENDLLTQHGSHMKRQDRQSSPIRSSYVVDYPEHYLPKYPPIPEPVVDLISDMVDDIEPEYKKDMRKIEESIVNESIDDKNNILENNFEFEF